MRRAPEQGGGDEHTEQQQQPAEQPAEQPAGSTFSDDTTLEEMRRAVIGQEVDMEADSATMEEDIMMTVGAVVKQTGDETLPRPLILVALSMSCYWPSAPIVATQPGESWRYTHHLE